MVCPNIGTKYCGSCPAAPHCQDLLALREGEDCCEFCGDPECEGECEEYGTYGDYDNGEY